MNSSGNCLILARAWIVLAAICALSACAPTPDPSYIPPPGLTAQTGATVIGSQLKTGPLRSNISMVLGQVDNLSTRLSNRNWQQPVLVAPGFHVLYVSSCECGGLTNEFGGVPLGANLVAGKTYIIHGTIPSFGLAIRPGSGTVWLADSGGSIVTPVTDMKTSPTPGGGPVFVPIFIPVK